MPIKVATWNTQGNGCWSTAIGYIRSNKTDILCLQECSHPKIFFKDKQFTPTANTTILSHDKKLNHFYLEYKMRSSKILVSYVSWSKSGTSSYNRCSLAMIYKSTDATKKYIAKLWKPNINDRPALSLRIGGKKLKEGTVIATIHAPANYRSKNYVEEIAYDLRFSETKWFLLGDMNVNLLNHKDDKDKPLKPDVLSTKIFEKKTILDLPGKVAIPEFNGKIQKTQKSGGCLDWGIYSSGAILTHKSSETKYRGSDHLCQFFVAG